MTIDAVNVGEHVPASPAESKSAPKTGTESK